MLRSLTDLRNSRFKYVAVVVMWCAALIMVPSYSQDSGELTVDQIMKSIIAPMTTTIWGAYDIQTDAQWQELQNAAITVVAAGNLLARTGDASGNSDWQEYNQQMVAAARAAVTAIANKDEEALFNAGNDQLYPPCESCHQKYMSQ